MSEQTHSKVLLAMGILGLLGTIGIQVMGFGSLKGRIENVIETHADLIREHTIELRNHDRLIERINGRMGLSASDSFQKWKADSKEAQQ